MATQTLERNEVFSGEGTPMEQIIRMSRFYGSDPEFVIAGGGNTSVKDEQNLWVKASGHALGTIAEDGFVVMHRNLLQELLDRTDVPSDPEKREQAFKDAIMAARVDPGKGQRPSVECAIHHLLPSRYVVHTHSTWVNMLTCCEGGENLVKELFGSDAIWVPYTDPGYTLAKSILEKLQAFQKETGSIYPPMIIMENHGLIVCGDTAEEIEATTNRVMGTIQERTGPLQLDAQGVADEEKRRLVLAISPMLRGLLAESDALKVVRFHDEDVETKYVSDEASLALQERGPLTPDQIVYCTSFPLVLDAEGIGEDDLLPALRDAIKKHIAEKKYLPKVVLVKRVGMFTIADNAKDASIIGLVYRDSMKVMMGAEALGRVQPLSVRNYQFIEEWEVEAYRKKISTGGGGQGRVARKIAFVTGAAQGFGLEISQDLAAEGAHVVLADLNSQKAEEESAALCEKHGVERSVSVSMNVADKQSVADAVYKAVRLYGGFDLFISNAGVLKAESVKTQSEKDFDFVTSVNYKGYYLCVQAVAPVMGLAHKVSSEYRSDIIQINSKSGLVGSNKNFAYAGGKFGGIGLTQSFALELVADGIKVNSICPGNFFDGPLWSDPENGLFVQYLRTGKVPGAKSIEDVKRAYEAKVPMGRGCTTPDVMKAIYYLVDQQYETGQAVPVTGGQVMLH